MNERGFKCWKSTKKERIAPLMLEFINQKHGRVNRKELFNWTTQQPWYKSRYDYYETLYFLLDRNNIERLGTDEFCITQVKPNNDDTLKQTLNQLQHQIKNEIKTAHLSRNEIEDIKFSLTKLLDYIQKEAN